MSLPPWQEDQYKLVSKEIQTLTTVFPQIINEEIHLREKGTEGGSQHIRCCNFHLKMVYKNVYDFLYKPKDGLHECLLFSLQTCDENVRSM